MIIIIIIKQTKQCCSSPIQTLNHIPIQPYLLQDLLGPFPNQLLIHAKSQSFGLLIAADVMALRALNAFFAV